MKILIISDFFPPLSWGGAERVAYYLAKEYRRLGHDVLVLTTTSQRDKVGRFDFEDLSIIRIHAYFHPRFQAYLGLYNPQTIRRVRQIFKEEQPDIVHVHNVINRFSFYTLAVLRSLRIPHVVTLHDATSVDYGKTTQCVDSRDLSEEPNVRYALSPWKTMLRYRLAYFPLRNFFIRSLLLAPDTVLVSISHDLQRLLQTNGIPTTHVIHNGIPIIQESVPSHDVVSFRKRYHLESQKILLFIGRVSSSKGAYVALAAFQEVVKHVPQTKLVFAGGDSRVNTMLRDEVQRMHLDDQVVFTGWLSGNDRIAAYQICDVVLTPSIYPDPFGLINLEAMFFKKPIVTSCFGGMKEIVLDRETGFVTNPFNIVLFAEFIVKLLTDGPLRERMGETGYQRLMSCFTIEKCASQYLHLLSSLHEKTPHSSKH